MHLGYPRLVELNETLTREPFNPKAPLERSWVLQKRGDVAGALADLEKYLEVAGGSPNPRSLVRSSSLHLSIDDPEGAIAILTAGLETCGDNNQCRIVLLRQRSKLRKALGDIDGAELDAATVLDLSRR
jgi:hypothetical protein